jgi:hypothetical protein
MAGEIMADGDMVGVEEDMADGEDGADGDMVDRSFEFIPRKVSTVLVYFFDTTLSVS